MWCSGGDDNDGCTHIIQLLLLLLLLLLDGVTAASGQIIILTTNHRERLDKAVTRNGRVDLHIPFPVMNHNQGMWYDGVM